MAEGRGARGAETVGRDEEVAHPRVRRGGGGTSKGKQEKIDYSTRAEQGLMTGGRAWHHTTQRPKILRTSTSRCRPEGPTSFTSHSAHATYWARTPASRRGSAYGEAFAGGGGKVECHQPGKPGTDWPRGRRARAAKIPKEKQAVRFDAAIATEGAGSARCWCATPRARRGPAPASDVQPETYRASKNFSRSK